MVIHWPFSSNEGLLHFKCRSTQPGRLSRAIAEQWASRLNKTVRFVEHVCLAKTHQTNLTHRWSSEFCRWNKLGVRLLSQESKPPNPSKWRQWRTDSVSDLMYESFTKYLANNVCQLVVGIQTASALIKPNDMPDTRPNRRPLAANRPFRFNLFMYISSGIQNTCRTLWQPSGKQSGKWQSLRSIDQNMAVLSGRGCPVDVQ